DPDLGDNGLLLYSLVNNQMNGFDIDENTGQIFTVSVAGKVGTFYLEVQAADQGTRRLAARTTVNVTIDSSSSNNKVVVVLNQKINVVEKNIAEVKRVLEDKLAWNIYIVDVYSNEYERKARSSTDVTYVKIIAFDEKNQEVPAEDVKRKLREQKSNIERELEQIFATSVTAAIEEAPADSASPERVAAIVLGVLLACALIAFLAYLLFTIKRKRYKRKDDQQHLVKKQDEIMEGIDNVCTADKNGSLRSLEKLEHANN
ncbi:FAT4 protein, partial [Ibidorhyncha struthersii]|nr:FAT4 protein [Ibidorhyncha struthersii]